MPLKNKPKKSLDYDQTVFTFKMNEASFKSFPTFVQIVKQVLQTTQSKTSLWEILQMRNIFHLQNYFVIFYISTKWSCYRFLKRVEYSTKNMINDHFVYCELRDLKYQINPRTKFISKETNLSRKDFTLQMCSAVHGNNGNSKLFRVYRKFITHLPFSC